MQAELPTLWCGLWEAWDSLTVVRFHENFGRLNCHFAYTTLPDNCSVRSLVADSPLCLLVTFPLQLEHPVCCPCVAPLLAPRTSMCCCHLALEPRALLCCFGTLMPRLPLPDPGWRALQAEEAEKRKAQEKAKKEIAELMVKAQSEAKASENAPNEEAAEKAETLSEELRQKVPPSAGMTLEVELTWGWLEGRFWVPAREAPAVMHCLLVTNSLSACNSGACYRAARQLLTEK